MERQGAEKFSDFYEKWMGQLEDLHQLLVACRKNSQEVGFEPIVNKLTAHHKEYYQVKWATAHEDVLPFFNPVWLSPLENAYLWITGWKPSTAFRLVKSLADGSAAVGVTEDQVKKIEDLRLKIKLEEEKVEREMERQQVAMADREMVQLAKMAGLVKRNGDSAAVSQVNGLVEAALSGLLAKLEKVMKMADCVRLKTMKGLLDVLTPVQCVDFLAASSILQIQMRKWGKKREML